MATDFIRGESEENSVMTIRKKALGISLAIMMAFVIIPTVAFAESAENVPVIGISLDQSSITVEEGSSQNITAILDPDNATNKNVVWSSSNESVATVNDGVVSGISSGTADVTATTEDGLHSASCKVSVYKMSESIDNTKQEDLNEEEQEEPADVVPPHEHELIKTDGEKPTCKESGNKEYWSCTSCGKIFSDSRGESETSLEELTIGALGHNYSSKWTVDTKATVKKDGSKSHHCTRCGYKKDKRSIPKASGCKLAVTSYRYSGGVKTPKIIVKDSKGNVISTSNYTVAKSKGRKNVGKYSYVISFKGEYTGKITKSFTIIPAKAAFSKITLPYSKLTVKAQKKPSAYGASGFQIAYKLKNGKWKYIKTSKQVTSIKKITKNKKYYLKIRAYKKAAGKTYYGAWSAQKTPVNKSIKVKFNANKGKVSQKTKNVKIFNKYGKLPKPTRYGYRFKGWYTKKTGGKKVTAKTYTKYYKNHTLYAHWLGPKGTGGKISKAEYKRIKRGMSYSDVCFLIGGSGDRTSAYTDKEYIENNHEEWVDTGYWDYEYDDDGNEYPHWVDDGYYETIYDGYWESYYHERYGFYGQNSGYVEFEFVDGELDEIYTYSFN